MFRPAGGWLLCMGNMGAFPVLEALLKLNHVNLYEVVQQKKDVESVSDVFQVLVFHRFGMKSYFKCYLNIYSVYICWILWIYIFYKWILIQHQCGFNRHIHCKNSIILLNARNYLVIIFASLKINLAVDKVKQPLIVNIWWNK